MTRMWMVNPKIMCHHHLLGEHREIHDLVRKIRKKMQLTGYITNNCIEIKSINSRHDILVCEFKRRNWKSGIHHDTPINFDINECSYLPKFVQEYTVNASLSEVDILNRCKRCGT